MKSNSIYTLLLAALLTAGLGACTDNDYTELDKGYTDLTATASESDLILHESRHSAQAISIEWTTGQNFGTGNAIDYTLELAETATDFADPVTVIDHARQTYSWRPTVEELNDILRSHFRLTPDAGISLDARVTARVEGSETLQTASVTFTASGYEPVSETLYIIGDAAPNGWSADNATEMARTDNGVFSWTGNLNAGELKFITTAGEFLPSYNNDGHGALTLRTSDDQPDLKFDITEPHCYKVDVNLLDLTVSFTPTEGVTPQFDRIFFVGNETDWTFRPMTQDPLDPFLFRIGVFFTKGGEFKFGTADGSWENMYKATTGNAPYTDSSVEFVKGYDPDNKWFLTDSDTGLAYKICLDIRTGAERMMMQLFNPYEEVYLVGDATPNGWDLGNATPMTRDAADPNVFTWSGHLNTGELKISADKQDDWNGAWFMATSENEAPTGAPQKVLFIDKSSAGCQAQYLDISTGGVDLKWRITEAGDYSITFNQLLEEITFSRQ